MALPAEKFQPEWLLEQRVTTLESDVRHIQADVSEIKSEVKQLAATVVQLKESVSDLRLTMVTGDAGLRESISNLRFEMQGSIAALQRGRLMDRIWWLLMLGAMLGVMARGFKWI